METVHLLISGKVQGVFFRATAKEIADKNKITGWIKNTVDNKVEVLASGESTGLCEFIKWCKQGPKNAKVDDVVITMVPSHLFTNFEIMRRN